MWLVKPLDPQGICLASRLHVTSPRFNPRLRFAFHQHIISVPPSWLNISRFLSSCRRLVTVSPLVCRGMPQCHLSTVGLGPRGQLDYISRGEYLRPRESRMLFLLGRHWYFIYPLGSSIILREYHARSSKPHGQLSDI